MALFVACHSFVFSADAKPYEVVMAFPVFGMPVDVQPIQDEMNKIVSMKIGATVKLVPINFSAYQQQLNLVLAGNEKWDLIANGYAFGLAGQVARKQLLPLDELISKYGQGYIDFAQESFRNGGKVNGSTYLTVNLRPMGANYGICMRKDLADKYKIDVKKIKTFDDAEKMFQIIKDNEPGMYAVAPQIAGTTMVYFFRSYDTLGSLDGVLTNYGQSLKVTNWFETDEYEANVNRVRKWYQAGYSMPNIATNKDAIVTFVRAGKLFSYVTNMKPGFEVQESNNTGMEMVTTELFPALSTTNDIATFGWAIPRSNRNPEKTMQFLNLLYADPQLSNLIINGIEGKHWAYVKGKKNTIDFPEGINSKNSSYYLGAQLGWLFPNQGITPVWAGNPPDFWDVFRAFNNNARRSKAIGFSFDATPIKTELAAVTNVLQQYQLTLENGVVDPTIKLPEFRAKLKAAGIDKIVAEKQKQLDAWVAATGVK